MVNQILGYLSGVIVLIGYIPYVRDILAKKTKPQRTSWFIWLILGGIAFFSQLAEGASSSLWMPGVQTIAVLLVFLLSIKNGMGGFEKRDKISLVLAGLGLLIWILSKEAIFALLMTIFADLMGGILSVIKSYEEPESETMITWVCDAISGLLAALAVGSFDVVLWLYPMYILLINLAVIVAIILGKRKLIRI